MRSTMQRVPLSINPLVERAGKLFPEVEIVSRLPDKSLRRHRFADFHRRTRRLAAALLAAGLKKGDRVATLCWNHYAHLECYFGIPAAGGVMHTLNLRLAPDEIGWIANHARRPVSRRRRHPAAALRAVQGEGEFRESDRGAVRRSESGLRRSSNYEDFHRQGAGKHSTTFPHEEDDPISMCYTSGTTGRPKGVVYSHRSTILHTLMANQPDHWGLPRATASAR